MLFSKTKSIANYMTVQRRLRLLMDDSESSFADQLLIKAICDRSSWQNKLPEKLQIAMKFASVIQKVWKQNQHG